MTQSLNPFGSMEPEMRRRKAVRLIVKGDWKDEARRNGIRPHHPFDHLTQGERDVCALLMDPIDFDTAAARMGKVRLETHGGIITYSAFHEAWRRAKAKLLITENGDLARLVLYRLGARIDECRFCAET